MIKNKEGKKKKGTIDHKMWHLAKKTASNTKFIFFSLLASFIASSSSQKVTDQTCTSSTQTCHPPQTETSNENPYWKFEERWRDYRPECHDWVEEGECNNNPGYILVNCPKSCIEWYKKQEQRKEEDPSENSNDQCQLYLAESSIPNSGLGMYTAKSINPLTRIFYPEIVINTFDYRHHQELQKYYKILQTQENGANSPTSKQIMDDENHRCGYWAELGECDANPRYMQTSCQFSCHIQSIIEKTNYQEKGKRMTEWLPTSYFWGSDSTHSRSEADHTESLVPGIGMLANSHLGLINTSMQLPLVDGGGLKRGKGEGGKMQQRNDGTKQDPGVGAFSRFHGLAYLAEAGISAGMEIFAGT